MGSVPRPKSPPELYGKRRELAKVVMLEREIGFLQEELKSIETLQPASSCIKQVADYVVTTPEPLINVCRKTRKSCRFWRWLFCGNSCFNMSCLSCCGGCSCNCLRGCCSFKTPRCCCNGGCCSLPLPDKCCSWSIPKPTCAFKPPSCPECLKPCSCCPTCNSSCCSTCGCRCCWPTKCSCSCWPTKCPSCSCSCWPTKCSFPRCPSCGGGCSLENNCCYSSYCQC
ncbi:uncharacterized protein LOC143572061 [Bidens hawaiensis]|uniref:uncharacterized protein LOC143572061 n=1 Tax=Bidens hawaiensis TaxID=980011 RepID=UPI00404B69AE